MKRTGVWRAAVLVALAGLPAAAEEKTAPPVDEVSAAVEATLQKGFTYLIRPTATLSDFNKAREALAGVPVRGEQAGGVYRATDGTYEIYRKGSAVAIRGGAGGAGWLPHAKFVSPLQVEVNQAFTGREGDVWRRGNVSKGRRALGEIIQIDHLMRRADLGRVLRLAEAFKGLKRTGSAKAGAVTTTTYTGELTAAGAYEILQGPFEELVRRKVLAFSNTAGVGKITVQNGVLKSVHLKATGSYLYYNEDDNAQKKGTAVLEVLGEVTKVGETKVAPPAEAAQVLSSAGRN